MYFLVALVVLVGFVASGTKLAWDDIITAPWRVRLREKRGEHNFWVRALECPRCTSVWISFLPTAGTLAVLGYANSATWIWWLILAVSWIPVSFAVAYFAYILILRGEA